MAWNELAMIRRMVPLRMNSKSHPSRQDLYQVSTLLN